MSLSKSFFVRVGKLENSRDNLIYELQKNAEKKRQIKIQIKRSSLTIKQGGMHTSKKAEFTKNKRAELSLLSLEYEYIKQAISKLNNQRKFENKSQQQYSSKLSQIFMVLAKQILPENEFSKVEKQAIKILENRRNNQN